MSINPIKTDFSERGITSLKKEQLSTDETILKVTIKQFTTAEFAQLPDSRKIEFQVKETAMQQISEQSPSKKVSVVVLPPSVVHQHGIWKTAAKVSAGILGGVLVTSGPVGYGLLLTGCVIYGGYKLFT